MASSAGARWACGRRADVGVDVGAAVAVAHGGAAAAAAAAAAEVSSCRRSKRLVRRCSPLRGLSAARFLPWNARGCGGGGGGDASSWAVTAAIHGSSGRRRGGCGVVVGGAW
jgi:hypothetical protein